MALNKKMEDYMNFNQKVDIVIGLKNQLTILEDKRTMQAQYTQDLKEIKEKKLAMIPKDMPVVGLSIDVENNCLTMDGLPFDETQISKSKIIATGIEIVMATNPTVRIIRIKDGALLDDETMDTLLAYMDEQGFQAFIEVVKRDKTAVTLEVEVREAG